MDLILQGIMKSTLHNCVNSIGHIFKNLNAIQNDGETEIHERQKAKGDEYRSVNKECYLNQEWCPLI